jgi:hypothetical protein
MVKKERNESETLDQNNHPLHEVHTIHMTDNYLLANPALIFSPMTGSTLAKQSDQEHQHRTRSTTEPKTTYR